MDDNSQRTTFDAMFPRKEFYEFSDKIMVAAIVSRSVVILFMSLLHLYARSVIRQRERRTLAARALALRVALTRSEWPELPKMGLDPSVIDTIPLFVYRARGNEGELVMECSVCLSIFEDGDMARVLPNCKHPFHAGCIDKWLGKNTTCPFCRAGAMPMLRLESREPPVRWGSFEMVTIRRAKLGRSASMSCLEGTSDVWSSTGATSGKAATSGSNMRFGPIRRILSCETLSPKTQSNSHEDSTEPDIENQSTRSDSAPIENSD